jgi:hypothetical protein
LLLVLEVRHQEIVLLLQPGQLDQAIVGLLRELRVQADHLSVPMLLFLRRRLQPQLDLLKAFLKRLNLLRQLELLERELALHLLQRVLQLDLHVVTLHSLCKLITSSHTNCSILDAELCFSSVFDLNFMIN